MSAPYINVGPNTIGPVTVESPASGGTVITAIDANNAAWGEPIAYGSYVASGDLTGTSTSQNVVGLEGRALPTIFPGLSGNLSWSGLQWTFTPFFVGSAAGGDLDGYYPNPQLIISGVTAGTYGTDGYNYPVITVDSKGRVTSLTTMPIQKANGVVAGSYGDASNYPTFTVDGYGNISLAGQLPLLVDNGVTPGTYGGDGYTTLQLVVDGYGRVSSVVPVAIEFPAPPAEYPMSGDVDGYTNSSTVVAINSNPVSITAPLPGQLLLENSTATGSMWSGLSGDVQLSASTPGLATVTGIDKNPVNVPTLGVGQDGYVATWNNTDGYIEFMPPNAQAEFTPGGDLSGTNVTQTVIGIQNLHVPMPTIAGTALTYTGTALQWGTEQGPSGNATSIVNVPIAGTPSTSGQGLISSFPRCLDLQAYQSAQYESGPPNLPAITSGGASVCGFIMCNDSVPSFSVQQGGYPTFNLQQSPNNSMFSFNNSFEQISLPSLNQNQWYFFAVTGTVGSPAILYLGPVGSVPTKYVGLIVGTYQSAESVTVQNNVGNDGYFSSFRYFTTTALTQDQVNAEAASPLVPVYTSGLTYHYFAPQAADLNGLLTDTVTQSNILTAAGGSSLVVPTPNLGPPTLEWEKSAFTPGGDLAGTSTTTEVVGILGEPLPEFPMFGVGENFNLQFTPNSPFPTITGTWSFARGGAAENVGNFPYGSSLYGAFGYSFIKNAEYYFNVFNYTSINPFSIIFNGNDLYNNLANYGEYQIAITITDVFGNAGTYPIVISDMNGYTINGNSNYTINNNYGSVKIIYAATYISTQWAIVASH